jgi:hypothetical protein
VGDDAITKEKIMATNNEIENGMYIVTPDGHDCSIIVEVEDEEIVSEIEQSDWGTHIAARDQWGDACSLAYADKLDSPDAVYDLWMASHGYDA